MPSAGLLVSLLGCRFLVSDSLRVRQLGVLLMEIRDYLDNLDGWVAR